MLQATSFRLFSDEYGDNPVGLDDCRVPHIHLRKYTIFRIIEYFHLTAMLSARDRGRGSVDLNMVAMQACPGETSARNPIQPIGDLPFQDI